MNEENLYRIEAAKTILFLFCSMSQPARQGLIKIILDEQAKNKDVVRLVRSYLELIHIKISLDDGDYSKRKEKISETSNQFINEYCQIEDDEEIILGYLLRYCVRGGKK
jgi:hypothetical protein